MTGAVLPAALQEGAQEAVRAAPLLVTAAAVLLAVLTWAVTRRADPALPVLLDLLMTAGLLRLTVDQGWHAIAGAATVVLVRKLVVAGIGRGRTAHGRLVRWPDAMRRT